MLRPSNAEPLSQSGAALTGHDLGGKSRPAGSFAIARRYFPGKATQVRAPPARNKFRTFLSNLSGFSPFIGKMSDIVYALSIERCKIEGVTMLKGATELLQLLARTFPKASRTEILPTHTSLDWPQSCLRQDIPRRSGQSAPAGALLANHDQFRWHS